MTKPYSVLLLYPDPVETETYFTHVSAADPQQALAAARAGAAIANDGAFQAEDFLCLAVIEGYVELELGIVDNV